MKISEFAKQYGYTKNKVKPYLKKLSQDATYRDSKNVIHLTEKGISELLALIPGGKSETDFKSVETSFETELRLLQSQIEDLKKDKAYLQELLKQAENRADFLTIQTLPFFKRRKALKEYNKRILLEPSEK